MRRWAAHLSDALCMLLRWAEATLALLPTAPPPPAAGGQSGALLSLEAALEEVAELLEGLARCVGEQSGAAAALAPAEREVALSLLTQTALQLAAAAAQLPAVLESGAGPVMAAAAAGPAIGPRLPLLAGPAAAAAWPAALLLRRCLPPLGVSTLAALHPQTLPPQGQGCEYFSRREATQGAALAACLACLGTLPGLPPLSPPGDAEGVCGRRHLLLQLAGAVPEVVDLAAGVQSAPLTLLPLCALEAARRALLAGPGAAGAGAMALVGAEQEAPEVFRLVSLLVVLMTQHPVELLRSCAHEALHAALDCMDPAARLAILSIMVQVGEGRCVNQVLPAHALGLSAPKAVHAVRSVSLHSYTRDLLYAAPLCLQEREAGSQAAAAVALQRLRLEVERAWPARGGALTASWTGYRYPLRERE